MEDSKKLLILGSNDLSSFLAQNLSDSYHITVVTNDEREMDGKKPFVDHVLYVQFPDYSFAQEAIQDYDCMIECLNLGGRIDSENRFAEHIKAPIAEHFNRALSEVQTSRLSKIIYIGNSNVYGDCKGDWVKETSKTYPNTPSAEFGLSIENSYLGCISKTLSVTVLRCGTLEEVRDRVIKSFIALARKAPMSYTGFKFVNSLSRRTLLRAIKKAIGTTKSNIYNLCDGEPKTFRHHLYAHLQAVGINGDFVKWGTEYEDINFSLDCSKAKKDGLIA